jgi:VWFA-related protein
LKRADFHLFEDGAEQKISSFSAEETPFAAAILLDTSGSMDARLTLGRGAAIRFLDGLRDEDVAAVYNFDAKVEQIQDFSPGRDLPAKAFKLKTRNQTALNDAVLTAALDLGSAKRSAARSSSCPTVARITATPVLTKPWTRPCKPARRFTPST